MRARQGDTHGGAEAFAALDFHPALVLLDDVANDGKTKAGAVGFGRVKGLTHPFEVFP